jgi:hypothetical protein
MPAFQRLASQRRCKSAEDLPRMQAISEEEILGQAAGVPGRLPSRLHRGNSEPETGRAELGADLEEGDPDENMDESRALLAWPALAVALHKIGPHFNNPLFQASNLQDGRS